MLLALPLKTWAKLDLPEIISSNMVLQQQTRVKIWGRTDQPHAVHITPSWNGKTYTAQPDKAGNWLVQIDTPAAGYMPYSMRISDGTTVELTNILIGEVWFCSGQSNMEMPLNGFINCPIENANETIAQAGKWKAIRVATIEKNGQLQPVDRVRGSWKISNTENAPWFSATAYHAAMMMNQVLDVPIGIINCSWGGTKVEGWLPRQIVETYPDIDLSKDIRKEGNHSWWHYLSPVLMYNGMLHPLENYTIKGFFWYQGESNVGHHDTYAQRLQTMVNLWRKEWGLGELPFYYVEIAPFGSEKGTAAARLREAQFKAQKLISNAAMISTNDLVQPYEQWNVHPKNKTKVGQRLAYVALTETYGVKGLAAYGPTYRSMEVKDSVAVLSFDHSEDGFTRMTGLEGFEIAGSDKVFYPAKAWVEDRVIKVSAKEVEHPVAVRYAFHDFCLGNVGGARGLPMVPFRTDNWEN